MIEYGLLLTSREDKIQRFMEESRVMSYPLLDLLLNSCSANANTILKFSCQTKFRFLKHSVVLN